VFELSNIASEGSDSRFEWSNTVSEGSYIVFGFSDIMCLSSQIWHLRVQIVYFSGQI